MAGVWGFQRDTKGVQFSNCEKMGTAGQNKDFVKYGFSDGSEYNFYPQIVKHDGARKCILPIREELKKGKEMVFIEISWEYLKTNDGNNIHRFCKITKKGISIFSKQNKEGYGGRMYNYIIGKNKGRCSKSKDRSCVPEKFLSDLEKIILSKKPAKAACFSILFEIGENLSPSLLEIDSKRGITFVP